MKEDSGNRLTGPLGGELGRIDAAKQPSSQRCAHDHEGDHLRGPLDLLRRDVGARKSPLKHLT